MNERRPQRLPRLLLVTGMSGAGKSTVLDTLEDMGWDIVDNLPADLLRDFVHGGNQCRTAPVAVAMDARSRGFDAERLPELLRSIEGVEPEILYLDCSGSELIRRYDETRRRHPLAPDRPAEDGIARERRLTAPLRTAADGVLDTTDLSPAELGDELKRRYGGGKAWAGTSNCITERKSTGTRSTAIISARTSEPGALHISRSTYEHSAVSVSRSACAMRSMDRSITNSVRPSPRVIGLRLR